jgi:hypothetical protein
MSNESIIASSNPALPLDEDDVLSASPTVLLLLRLLEALDDVDD